MLALGAAAPASADSLDAAIDHNLAFAAAQLNRTLAEVPTGAYPHDTMSDGRWRTRPAGWWISGFLPGSLWLMYQATGDPAWRTAAASRQAGVESQKTRTDSHDLGFMILDSFGQGYRMTGDTAYRSVALTAASSLATRYSPIVRATRSWDNTSADEPTDFKVIVDNMMNLELLLWAWRQTGDTGHRSKALEHALRSAAEHVRADGSTHHLVVFDSNTGAVKRKQTVQGYSDTSTWSRGQAWALYGFTMAFRELRDSRMLDTARRVADWYIGHLPADRVPYWDFDAPGIPSEPRDSSAAAIAASGLLELSRIETDPARAQQYLDAARATLTSLSSPTYLAEGTSHRSILLHGTSNKPGGDFDRGLIYGDYYFLEAMLRYRAIARRADLQPEERGPDFNGDGFDDLAVGSPGEDEGSLTDMGYVNVRYGRAQSLTSAGAQRFTQNLAGHPAESGDRFGTSMATGDFDRDGYTDLAVGAPYEDAGASTPDSGQVTVLYGSSSGLTATRAQQFNQSHAAGVVEPNDRYGQALASGDFDGDGYADLAAGAPGEGAPSVPDTGEVNVLHGGPSGLSSAGAERFGQGQAGGLSRSKELFGAALAAGRVNGDGYADLAVGAPGIPDSPNPGDGGVITLVYGGVDGIEPSVNQQFDQSWTGNAVETGDRFGASVAIGRFNEDAYGDVAGGAPNEDGACACPDYMGEVGVINVAYGASSGLARDNRAKQFTQVGVGGRSEGSDRFGSVLAAARLDGDPYADLAIGTPLEDVPDTSSASADAGQVAVMHGSTGAGLTPNRARRFELGTTSNSVAADDRFGSALGLGDFNGDDVFDAAMGAPGDGYPSLPDAGWVKALHGRPTAFGFTALSFTQGNTAGFTEAGDRFGAAMP